MLKSKLGRAAAGALLVVCGSVSGASVNTTFEVRLTIDPTCTVDTITDMDFGNQSFLTAALTNQTSITVNCTDGTDAVVDLSGTGGSRSMSNGTDAIGYDLYQDAAHTTYWDSANTVTIQGVGVDAAGTTLDATEATGTTRTIYGHVPAQPTSSTGLYTDSVTATVTFN